ncbi:MAG: alpha-N-acetylglucosaminidase [Streptosporangiales bacterium]|nr:alpha-N-acetylglucosaminidase [Streptosporangiales bacterium]
MDWPRWERELDRLALHGVNLPFVLTGHEAVIQRAFRGLDPGLDDAGVRAFLGGPAYLPFVTMGCLAGWDGPATQGWVDRRAELGARVIGRARELGMRPVLPGFAGHVPQQLAGRASTQVVDWTGFTTHALDPTDPLFADLGERYVAAQRELFGGTDHLYLADPFIESVPPAQTLDEVAATAAAVYEGMRRGDPDATWVFQSWPFTYQEDYWSADRIRAFLGAVPDDRTIILDLWSEHRPVTAALGSGKPWLWCMLHNFGGRPGMYGKLGTVATAPAASGAVGLGATMEDDRGDPVLYELLADVAWSGAVDLDSWLPGWVDARYGRVDAETGDALRRAWGLLRDTVYAADAPGPPGAVLLRRPVADGDLVPAPFLLSEAPRWRQVPDELWTAWELLAGAATAIASTGPDAARTAIGRDLADVAYLVVGTLGDHAQAEAASAYLAGDEAAFAAAARRFLTGIEDLERLLATRPEYLLGRWLADAASWGETGDERHAYEADARRILTLWGPPDGALVDYARRGWSGLLGTYYLPRWRRWVDALGSALRAGRPVDPVAFDADLRTFDAAWVEDGPAAGTLPTEPSGDTAAVACDLYARWHSRPT